jgi:hypothetical protein
MLAYPKVVLIRSNVRSKHNDQAQMALAVFFCITFTFKPVHSELFVTNKHQV